MSAYMVSGRFLAPYLRHFGRHFGPFWTAFSNKKREKYHPENHGKNDRPKPRNLTPKGHQNDPENDAKMHQKSMQK